MQTSDLQELAQHTRFMREGGVALLLASVVLALFLIVPSAPKYPSGAAVASTTPDAYAQVAIQAKAAIVYDLARGEVLYAKNADAQLPLASLTTLLADYAVATDAAAASGQVPSAAMLASAAASLGLVQTYAVDPQGREPSSAISSGYGSARDLAVLAGALARVAPQLSVSSQDQSAMPVPGLLLSRTSSSALAGTNLALVFDAGVAHPVAIVVLGAPQALSGDSAALVNATLAHFSETAAP